MVSPLRASRLAQDIDKLCTECASLIDNHDKIKDLSAVHYNLGKTLQDVENIVALPQQAAEAEDMLKDDTQLSEARQDSSQRHVSPCQHQPFQKQRHAGALACHRRPCNRLKHTAEPDPLMDDRAVL